MSMPALRSHPYPVADQQGSPHRKSVCHAVVPLLPRSKEASVAEIYKLDQFIIRFATLATLNRHRLMNRASAGARASCGIAWRTWRAWQIQFSLSKQMDRYVPLGATLCHPRSKSL